MNIDRFLPDGGTALAEGRVRLPPCVMLTQLTVESHIPMEVLPGQTTIAIELNSHLFSFLVPMPLEEIRKHFEHNALLILVNFTRPMQRSALNGERFRDVLCEVKR